jgi:predicted enzyme related to lactoylglutathione lyase
MAKFAMAMLVSADLPRSRDFYRDVFGLPVGTDSPEWIDLELGGGATLGLHPPSDYLQLLPGSTQLGFEVPDVDAFVRDAYAKGAQVAMDPRDESFGRLAVLVDPDGYMVQVYTPRPGAAA